MQKKLAKSHERTFLLTTCPYVKDPLGDFFEHFSRANESLIISDRKMFVEKFDPVSFLNRKCVVEKGRHCACNFNEISFENSNKQLYLFDIR